MNKKRQKHSFNMSSRLTFLIGCMLIVGFLILVRLLQLQVFGGDQYRQDAISQRRRAVEIDPKRGSIYDRNKEPLAVSVTVNTCYLNPKEVTNPEDTAALLSRILNLEQSTVMDAIQSNKDTVKLKTKLTQSEVDQIRTSGLRSLSVRQEDSRFYPEGTLLSQTIGFINDDGQGVYGLESKYENILAGTSGRKVYSRDLKGNIIPYEENSEVDSTAGHSLILTVDKQLQASVSKHLKDAYDRFKPDNISAIVMDPNTGEVLAIENYPHFDNNTPRTLVTEQDMARWNTMNEEERLQQLYEVWKNPIVSNTYEPGSVYKAITTAIALEEKTSSPSSTYTCHGTMEIADGVTIRCWRYYQPHGEQTLEEALLNSCNPAFVQIVREIGPELFFEYSKSLRIGVRTGIDLPGETFGAFPNSYEKIADVRLATMSYGHGVSVTPIELIAAANAVINGGNYYKPHLVSKVIDEEDTVIEEFQPEKQTQVFSAETSKTMREFLERNVEKGGGKAIAREGYRIGGKTGTTIKLVDGAYNDNMTVASFWSFYPADQPKYSILVISDNPKEASSGADAAGGAVRAILSDIIERESGAVLQPQNTGLVSVPNLSGLTVLEAAEQLESRGLKMSVYGDMGKYTIIDSQNPVLDKLVAADSQVEVRPGDSPRVRVPNFVGLTKAEVEQALHNAGLSVELTGDGKVTAQNAQPGTLIPQQQTIQLELKAE